MTLVGSGLLHHSRYLLPVYLCRACACIAGVYRANFDPREYTGDTSLTSTRENSRPSDRVQLLIGNVPSTELLTTSSGSCTVFAIWKAAVRYRRNGCRSTTRQSDRPGYDDDRPGAQTRRRAPERR